MNRTFEKQMLRYFKGKEHKM